MTLEMDGRKLERKEAVDTPTVTDSASDNAKGGEKGHIDLSEYTMPPAPEAAEDTGGRDIDLANEKMPPLPQSDIQDVRRSEGSPSSIPHE
jgi:hypothetical protein